MMSGITRFLPAGAKTRDFFMWGGGNSGFRGSSGGISTVDVTRFRGLGVKTSDIHQLDRRTRAGASLVLLRNELKGVPTPF